MRYEQHYAWSILLRLFHWSFALSIVALVVTGFYIHHPWTNTLLEGDSSFPVGTMRYIHFVAGFVFTGSLLARLYLLIFGNKQERVWDFLPVTPRNIRNLLCTLGFYLYCPVKHEIKLGHNVLAGTFYLITFVMALLQLVSGFYMLYPESMAWQKWGLMLGPQQQARYIHFLIMWYFILFAFIHVYIVVWNDIKSKEGLISSIFNGTKYTHSS
ncbi:MAG TPA: Ni/Fe-hydrogenase, b-type cytochrome subunit [Desulfobulbaceae bacterium]|nr:Ni/Fe-hydrogenase, b-type cytochrome subunit [Desulfobulbaceae bacterium]